jgi:putative PIN family toxin of toxin-antitoxin system
VRIVLDTSVLVAAVRSQTGASRALLSAALGPQVKFLISNPLILEYEAVLTRREHLLAFGLCISEVEELIDVICAAGIEVRMTRSWRPLLCDPDDEVVLETAINGQADAIITFNRADFAGIPVQFPVVVLSPQEALKRMEMR